MAKRDFDIQNDFLAYIKDPTHKKQMADVFGQASTWLIQEGSPENPRTLGSQWVGKGKKAPKKSIVICTNTDGVNKVFKNCKAYAEKKWDAKAKKWITNKNPKKGGNSQKPTFNLGFQLGPNSQMKVQVAQTNLPEEKVNAAAMTRAQELGSLFVFERAIRHNESWATWEKLKADPIVSKYMTKLWKDVCKLDQVTDDWYENFWKQNQTLLKKCSKGDFTVFDREGTFMQWVSGYVAGKGWASKGKKDNWNPADIWLINNEDKWIKHLEEHTDEKHMTNMRVRMRDRIDPQLLQFNAIMRDLWRKKQIWGISLKKVSGDEALWSEVNLHWNTVGKFMGLNQLKTTEYHYVSTLCDCAKKEKKGVITLSTQDTTLIVQGDGTTKYKFQIKANDSQKFSGLKYEPQDKDAGAARLGKATVEYVEDLFKQYGSSRKFVGSSAAYPQEASELLDHEKKWLDRIKRVASAGVFFGQVKSFQEVYDNLLFLFSVHPQVANSKLMQIAWLDAFFSLSRKDRDKFVTDMVFIAQKMGLRYGPFAKIY
tara:strand:+ start:195 stop:1811 length:1617 start_codon:yes stop_codon:yes gene_type:complete